MTRNQKTGLIIGGVITAVAVYLFTRPKTAVVPLVQPSPGTGSLLSLQGASGLLASISKIVNPSGQVQSTEPLPGLQEVAQPAGSLSVANTIDTGSLQPMTISPPQDYVIPPDASGFVSTDQL
jgi:hypothetical protein